MTVGIGLATAGDETIVVIRDVTEARRREAIRETFIGVLSHELRTPVTTIFGGAKLLAREHTTLDEETRRGIFQDIYEEAERLQRLVEDVVALNRFSDEVGEVGWEPVLLQRLVPGVVHSEEAPLAGRDVRPRRRVGPADRDGRPDLRRAGRPQPAVERGEVRRRRVDGDGRRRRRATTRSLVRVLDDGPGFPPTRPTSLFDLFYRSPGTAGVASGAGIGLFVCSRLIRAMGGRIWASPRPRVAPSSGSRCGSSTSSRGAHSQRRQRATPRITTASATIAAMTTPEVVGVLEERQLEVHPHDARPGRPRAGSTADSRVSSFMTSFASLAARPIWMSNVPSRRLAQVLDRVDRPVEPVGQPGPGRPEVVVERHLRPGERGERDALRGEGPSDQPDPAPDADDLGEHVAAAAGRRSARSSRRSISRSMVSTTRGIRSAPRRRWPPRSPPRPAPRGASRLRSRRRAARAPRAVRRGR